MLIKSILLRSIHPPALHSDRMDWHHSISAQNKYCYTSMFIFFIECAISFQKATYSRHQIKAIYMQSIEDRRQRQQKLYSQSFHHRTTHTVDFHAFRHLSIYQFDPSAINPPTVAATAHQTCIGGKLFCYCDEPMSRGWSFIFLKRNPSSQFIAVDLMSRKMRAYFLRLLRKILRQISNIINSIKWVVDSRYQLWLYFMLLYLMRL